MFAGRIGILCVGVAPEALGYLGELPDVGRGRHGPCVTVCNDRLISQIIAPGVHGVFLARSRRTQIQASRAWAVPDGATIRGGLLN